MFKRAAIWIDEKFKQSQTEKALQEYARVEFKKDYELLRQSNQHENRCAIDAMVRRARIGC